MATVLYRFFLLGGGGGSGRPGKKANQMSGKSQKKPKMRARSFFIYRRRFYVDKSIFVKAWTVVLFCTTATISPVRRWCCCRRRNRRQQQTTNAPRVSHFSADDGRTKTSRASPPATEQRKRKGAIHRGNRSRDSPTQIDVVLGTPVLFFHRRESIGGS